MKILIQIIQRKWQKIKKKNSKNFKCYSVFGPIEGHIVGTCKLIYNGIC